MRSGWWQQTVVLCLVVGGHLAALALTLAHSIEPVIEPEPITPPAIVGIMLPPPVAAPQPKPVPELQPQPQSKPKQQPKPAPKPLPKAPPSEKAVKAPSVTPAKPPVQPAKTAPANTASRNTMPTKAAPVAAAIQLPSAEALGLHNKAPVYPQLSRKKKEQGTVVLLVLVKADGTVGEIQLKTSSGFSRLDQAAFQGVKRWQFQPALEQGKPVDYWYELPMTFRLNPR